MNELQMYVIVPTDPDRHGDLTTCIIFLRPDEGGRHKALAIAREEEVNPGPVHVGYEATVPATGEIYTGRPYIY